LSTRLSGKTEWLRGRKAASVAAHHT